MQVKPLAEVIAFLQPIANRIGVEIIDAQWNAREKSLTVFIDREGGVDMNLCEAFHRAIDEPLDELDPLTAQSIRSTVRPRGWTVLLRPSATL